MLTVLPQQQHLITNKTNLDSVIDIPITVIPYYRKPISWRAKGRFL